MILDCAKGLAEIWWMCEFLRGDGNSEVEQG